MSNIEITTINGVPHVPLHAVETILTNFSHVALCEPNQINNALMQNSIDEFYGTNNRFNVLIPQARELDNSDLSPNECYIVLSSPARFTGQYYGHRPLPKEYNVVCEDDERKITLYSVTTHTWTTMPLIDVLSGWFWHESMIEDEVLTTFFTEDDPVYGAYFDRERIIATLKDLWSAGACEPETLEIISNFIGVDLLELIND